MRIWIALGLALLPFGSAMAASYTEELKEELNSDSTAESSARTKSSKTPFLDRVRNQIDQDNLDLSSDEREQREGSVIESVQAEPRRQSPLKNTQGYTQRLKAELQKEDQRRARSAIESVKSGKDELKAVKKGPITRAGSFVIGPQLTHSVSIPGEKSNDDFRSFYTELLIPDLGISYDFQLFRNRWLGSLSFGADITTAIFKGAGNFSDTNLTNELTDKPFPQESAINFSFVIIPVIATATYRLNWAHEVLQPFISAGYGATFYQENRDDGVGSRYGYSPTVKMAAGLNFSMDWIFDRNSWSLYEDFKIQRFYLSLVYSRWSSQAGRVDFSSDGYLAGMSYEF